MSVSNEIVTDSVTATGVVTGARLAGPGFSGDLPARAALAAQLFDSTAFRRRPTQPMRPPRPDQNSPGVGSIGAVSTSIAESRSPSRSTPPGPTLMSSAIGRTPG